MCFTITAAGDVPMTRLLTQVPNAVHYENVSGAVFQHLSFLRNSTGRVVLSIHGILMLNVPNAEPTSW